MSDTSTRSLLREAYPELSDEDLEEVEENLRQYVAVVYRVHLRPYNDPEARKELKRLRRERGWESQEKDNPGHHDPGQREERFQPPLL